jgi:hypothetical protein
MSNNRPISNNLLAKSSPIASIKREQAAFDPLLDNNQPLQAQQSSNRSSSNSPLLSTEQRERNIEIDNSQGYASPIPPTGASGGLRPPSLISGNGNDIADVVADQILSDCR